MTDSTTARDRTIDDLVARVEAQAEIAPRTGEYSELISIAHGLRALAAPDANVAAEPGPRERLLREYMIRIATKVGHRTALALDNVYDIERFGEDVLAELERRATVNSELGVHAASTSDSESEVHSPADVYNLRRWPRRPLSWELPLSAADQAQLDDLRARMEAEEGQ